MKKTILVPSLLYWSPNKNTISITSSKSPIVRLPVHHSVKPIIQQQARSYVFLFFFSPSKLLDHVLMPKYMFPSCKAIYQLCSSKFHMLSWSRHFPEFETFCYVFMSGAVSLLLNMLETFIYLSDFVVDLSDLFFFPFSPAFSRELIDIFRGVITACFFSPLSS